eukprot:10567341-Prorocentrum_lima.AAC.1
MCKRIGTCPCLTGGEHFHVFSLGHGPPGTPVRLKGSHIWSSLPVDRLLLGVQRVRLQGFPERIAGVDGCSTL